jgi:CheY-like chemotaxis protein
MAKSGPIIIVDDDIDDQEMLEEVMRDLKVSNKLIYFKMGEEAFKFLKATSEQPFIIFCDVNLLGQSGIEFKRHIDSDKQLRQKSIPFVFYSTSVNQGDVNEAYTKMTVQGYFKKATSYEAMKRTIALILNYWAECRHPNTA